MANAGAVKLHISLPNHWWHSSESLWAQPLGDDLYQIDNVPFCAYGLNLGDVVLATAGSPDLKPEVRAVVRRSGNRTLRVSFCDKLTRDDQAPVLAQLEAAGGEPERADAQFVCLNIPPAVNIEAVRAMLDEYQRHGTLDYETCEERVPGSFDDKPGNAPRREA